MMTNNDDFRDLPTLGPAGDDLDRDSVVTRKASEPAEAPSESEGRRGSGWLVGLVVLSIAAMAGVGTWGYLEFTRMQQQMAAQQRHIDQQSAALGLTSQRMPELENLISSTDESISKSGKALQSQINQLEELQLERAKQVDQALAKLQSQADQRNQSLRQEQDKGLKELSAELAALTQQMAALEGAQRTQERAANQLRESLAAVEGAVKPLGQSLKDLNKQLSDQRQAQVGIAERLKVVADTSATLTERTQSIERQLQVASQRLDKVPSQLAVPPEFERKLKEVDQAIDAIDGFRLQTNQELLQLKRRLNRMQLSLEQMAPAAQ